MADIFISYAREDIDFVRRLHEALAERERETWIDFEGIPPSAEWLAEIRSAIDSAQAFVFVLTPASAASKVCAEELRHALGQHKRLIPILRTEVDASEVADDLARLNWIFFRDGDDFEAACESLLGAVDTDLDWVRDHTRLLERAREWDQGGRDASATLRGRDLEHFEEWIALGPDREPQPTALQSHYVLASRRAATVRQRWIWGSIALGLAVAVGLSILAYTQSREKARQRELAAARELINRAEALRDRPPDRLGVTYLEESVVAAARALGGFDRLGMPSVEADRAVRAGMALLPRLVSEHELTLPCP